jgi:aryl-alcohol dehydrogenase-like predicted oxidoreductase
MRYGIANGSGQPSKMEASSILASAHRHGFSHLDTAAAYGESESVIGALLPHIDPGASLKVVSKIPFGLPIENWSAQLERSLQKLGRSHLDGWLLHNDSDFPRLDKVALDLVSEHMSKGKVRAFGVSCYSPEVALAALEMPQVSLLQVPANVFDRRFLSQKLLVLLQSRKCFLFVRSAFLQGLCLLPPNAVPARVPGGRQAVATLVNFCRQHDLSPQAFCLHYLADRLKTVPHSIIVGVEKTEQLDELAAFAVQPSPPEEVFGAWEEIFPQGNIHLVNPQLWPHA